MCRAAVLHIFRCVCGEKLMPSGLDLPGSQTPTLSPDSGRSMSLAGWLVPGDACRSSAHANCAPLFMCVCATVHGATCRRPLCAPPVDVQPRHGRH